jgi:CDP-glycerol glycerophosphotransferase (TagB/SpsB family)
MVKIKNRKNFIIWLINLKIKIFLTFNILLLFFISSNDFNKKLENGKNNENADNFIFLNPYLLSNYPNKYLTRFEYFNVSNVNYNYSFKYKLIKIEYKIGFFDDNKMIINPSFLALYNNLQILCELKIINSNIIIYSLPNIYQNKYFTCIEFFSIRERVKLGIKIYIKGKMEYNYFYLFSERRINFRNLKYKNNYLFDPLVINKNITFLFEKIYNKKVNETLKFKKSYVKYPYFTDKKNSVFYENKWNYKNIYNNYFCLCKGEKCLNSNINQKCKYYFYLTIIEGNRYVYNKTGYLFVDFIFAELSSDDVYPIFEKMVEQNIPSYYLTENSEIYYKYCYQKSECFRIIFVNKSNYKINGDFLEKYLFLFLKLKAVVSGRSQSFNYATNIFYTLEYVQYIGVGHGVSFFKYFLYSPHETYGIKQNDKLVLPLSDKLISVAKRYGWTEDKIIKMNLPRWDKYNNYQNFDNKMVNNSIFIMFTWRDLKKKKTISSDYFKNIIDLIENSILCKCLEKNNIILYFTLHHLLENYINKYKKKYKDSKYIHYITDKDISNCLSTTSLIVSDFSSIIFDQIYRRKPFVIYVPDANDPEIRNLYTNNYFELIQSMKNGSIEFENKFFELNETVNKIIYYINNKFKLDEKLIVFYDSFHLEKKEHTKLFINYLKNMQ